MTRLSIVIVTFNSRHEIDACIESLVRHAPAVAHDITIVDNSSSDGTAQAVRDRWPQVRVIDAGRNAGFAAANNIGIRHTSGELILLLNPDTVISAGAIDALIGAIDRRPDLAIAGPRLVDAAGRAELSFGEMIGPLAEWRQKRRGRSSEYVERVTTIAADVDWVSGACLLVRRVDAEAVGLLDERFFMYTEDVDFCAAVRARGRRVAFVPDAVVKHLRGRSRQSAAAAVEAAYRRSQIAFYEKHHPGWAPLLRAYLRILGKLRS